MHKSNTMMPFLTSALLLGAAASPAFAQQGARSGSGAGQAEAGQAVPRGDLDRTQDRLCERDGTCDEDRDRDRLRDHDTAADRDQLRDRDYSGDQDRDRDRLQTSRTVDDQLVALSLLTSEERTRFRSEMRSATTAAERSRVRAEHRRTIEQRAREMGIDPPPVAGAGLGYEARGGYMLMSVLTDQERAQFMNRMRAAQSVQERQKIRTEMDTMARERAREMGVEVPDWYGRSPGAQ